MISIDELQFMMGEDAKIDTAELGKESTRIPQLHSKYLNLLMDLKPELRKATRNIRAIRCLKFQYYTGKMSIEELAKYKWEPFQFKILKSDLDMYIDADTDIQLAQKYIDELEVRIEMLEDFIKALNNRNFMIKNHIEWHKFTNGIS